jgi:hypothetical protein
LISLYSFIVFDSFRYFIFLFMLCTFPKIIYYHFDFNGRHYFISYCIHYVLYYCYILRLLSMAFAFIMIIFLDIAFHSTRGHTLNPVRLDKAASQPCSRAILMHALNSKFSILSNTSSHTTGHVRPRTRQHAKKCLPHLIEISSLPRPSSPRAYFFQSLLLLTTRLATYTECLIS